MGPGVGVGPLVWSLLSDLRVAGAGALSWVEPEAKWPKEVLTPGVCARMPLRLAGLEVRVGVGVGVGRVVVPPKALVAVLTEYKRRGRINST